MQNHTLMDMKLNFFIIAFLMNFVKYDSYECLSHAVKFSLNYLGFG